MGWQAARGRHTRKPQVCFGLVLQDFKEDVGEACMFLGLELDMSAKGEKGFYEAIRQAGRCVVLVLLVLVVGRATRPAGGMEIDGDGDGALSRRRNEKGPTTQHNTIQHNIPA